MALLKWPALTFAAVSLLLPPSCVTSPADEPEVRIQPKPELSPEQDSATKDLARLKNVVGSNQNLQRVVADITAILEAEAAAAKGDSKKAQEHWKKAVTEASGRFGQYALKGWVRSYAEGLGKKTDRNILARLLIAELDSGRISTALIESGLDEEEKMVAYLADVVPDALTPEVKPTQPKETLTKGAPADDPMLEDYFSKRCGPDSQQYDWQTWEKTLSQGYLVYWDTLMAVCRSGAKSLSTVQSGYQKLAQMREYALAAELAERAAVMHRRTASRSGAANAYRDLMTYWEKGALKPADFGLDLPEFTLRRVNEHLWAARYRALIGDYELGKIYAQRGLDFAAKGFSENSGAGNKFREDLATLRAEGYHILAYRIALEKKEYQSALSLSKLALESNYLNEEWEDRLIWLIGLYEYMSHNYATAVKNWEKLLAQTDDASMKTTSYFWLARAYTEMGRKSEARSYMVRLTQEYPLSYYSVVAPIETGLLSKPMWPDVFGDLTQLSKKFKERSGQYDLATLRREPVSGRLLMRAEVLVSAGLHKWAQIATNELSGRINRYSVSAYPGLYVYLSRLHYGAGNYLAAIAVTTKVANEVDRFWQAWPEQLLVYFPRPYADVFQRNSLDNAVSEELLFGISRQESGFRADIRSHANAIGIMQLIPPTGERFRSGIAESKPIESVLLDPEANIAIGSRYLKYLSVYYKGNQPHVFAGYNAGEYAVDAWIERRAQPDPLVFIETIPFGETKGYVKNVWRNLRVYRYLDRFGPKLASNPNHLLSKPKVASKAAN